MERKIIVVEDNPADAKILGIALARCDATIQTTFFDDGARAMDFFSSTDSAGLAPCDLILLDLNLPRVGGFEILEFLKAHPDLKSIPVVVLSGSSSQRDVERCYAAGANSYICKPTGIDRVFLMAAHVISYWFDCAQLPNRVKSAAKATL